MVDGWIGCLIGDGSGGGGGRGGEVRAAWLVGWVWVILGGEVLLFCCVVVRSLRKIAFNI